MHSAVAAAPTDKQRAGRALSRHDGAMVFICISERTPLPC